MDFICPVCKHYISTKHDNVEEFEGRSWYTCLTCGEAWPEDLVNEVTSETDTVRGRYSPSGEVHISYNSMLTTLFADPLKKTKYLPCDICGNLQVVKINTISVTCNRCDQHMKDFSGDDSIYAYL